MSREKIFNVEQESSQFRTIYSDWFSGGVFQGTARMIFSNRRPTDQTISHEVTSTLGETRTETGRIMTVTNEAEVVLTLDSLFKFNRWINEVTATALEEFKKRNPEAKIPPHWRAYKNDV